MKYKDRTRNTRSKNKWKYQQEGPLPDDNVIYSDGMDFEMVVDKDLEEEDDMDAGDAAFMRGYLEERPYQERPYM